MSLGQANPGQLWQWWKYATRNWIWGTDDLRVISCCATGPIPAGVLVQVDPSDNGRGPTKIRVAQDTTRIVGVSAYDPNFHSPKVVYQQFDMLPVVRRGRVFAAFQGLATPGACANVRFVAGTGVFTADASGTAISKICFSVDTEQQYINSDGSPQADVPFPVPPVPAGATNTEFSGNACLLEVNLP